MKKKIFYHLRAVLAFLFSLLPLRLLEGPWRFAGKCIANAENHDIRKNGEERLIARFLDRHRNQKSITVYDIGANIGAWSAEILKRRPDATLYAFEMIPSFAEQTAQRLQNYKSARVFNTPLSDEAHELEVFQHSGGASVTGNPYHPARAEKHSVRSETGDVFVQEKNLAPPDFIKIDIDGHEMKALQGLTKTIAAARPYVQFEYSFYYVHERVFLKDMFVFFENMNYELYRIFPTKLVRRAYRPALENFWTVNYLARPKEKPAL